MRRPKIAAAPRPNRIVIGGAGTGVPLDPEVDPVVPPLVPPLVFVQSPLVLLVMLPELLVLVETSLLFSLLFLLELLFSFELLLLLLLWL